MTKFQVGQIVTWGSGKPRGKVISVEGVEPLNKSPACLVELVQDQVGICGRTYPVGTQTRIPNDELRAVN